MDFVPLPHFSSEKVALWFAQVESVLNLNAIETDADKYDYVVAHIPLQYSSMLEDILLNPPPESKYDHLKYEFIKRMSISWLKQEELCNDKPSEYLRRLRSKADQRVPIEIILNIWLNNLPEAVREVVSLETSGHVDVVAVMADKVMALLPKNNIGNNISVVPDKSDVMISKIEELIKQLKMLKMVACPCISCARKTAEPC